MRLLALLTLCVACGAIVALGTALWCHFASVRLDPSTRYALYIGADLPPSCRAGWPPEIPSRAQVLADCGVGFTRLEIRWKRGEATDLPVSRCFMTMLGWPQPLFSSGSEALGRYGAIDLPGWTLADDALDRSVATPALRTTMNWSGLLFDIVTFSLPLLATAVWIPRLGGSLVARTKWTVTIATAAWILGLILPELGLISMWLSGRGYFALTQTASYSTPEEFGVRETIQLFTPTSDSPEYYQGFDASNFAVSWRCQDLLILSSDGASAAVKRRGQIMTAGWPFRAFVAGDSTSTLLPTGDLSHLRVHWLRWLMNVFVLAAMLAMFFIPMWVRRQMRQTRGQCLACGYPLGSRAVCSECGAVRGDGIRAHVHRPQVAPPERRHPIGM